ncbi:type III secretion system translocon subunit SctE [Bordetella genomosp. 8]|nr:type III secretion system translocon subunit SctE [Bordetella genomosp. 8]
MSTSIQNPGPLSWSGDAMVVTGGNANAKEASDPLDAIVRAIEDIVGSVGGPRDDTEARRSTVKATETHDANGAPFLAAPGAPSVSPLSAPSPLNVGLLVSEVQGLRNEANGALVNDRTNESYDQMKARVDRYVDAQMNSIKEFEQKAADFLENAGRWYNRLTSWVSETLGPYMPYVTVAIAAVATVATGGAAWPALALAGAALANHVLKQNGIDVVGAVSDAIKSSGKAVSEQAANTLADTVGAVMGLLLADPNPLAKFCGNIAKAFGASKETVERVEFWGQLVGMAIVVIGNLAVAGGGAVVKSVSKALSGLGAGSGSVASNVASAATETLKRFVDSMKTLAQDVIQIIRQSLAKLKELAQLFQKAMQSAKNLNVATARGAAATVRDSVAGWQPRIETAAKVAQTAVNGANGGIGGANGWRNLSLGMAQWDVEIAQAYRRKTEQLLGITREQMHDTDEITRRSMDRVARNLQANADLTRDYTGELATRASIQSEQMTA